jgi:hypothetical protein
MKAESTSSTHLNLSVLSPNEATSRRLVLEQVLKGVESALRGRDNHMAQIAPKRASKQCTSSAIVSSEESGLKAAGGRTKSAFGMLISAQETPLIILHRQSSHSMAPRPGTSSDMGSDCRALDDDATSGVWTGQTGYQRLDL